jgi:hypothetical protein
LPDLLAVFGSFFATFSLFASLVTSIPADVIYDQTLINQIFKFYEDRVDKKEKENKKDKEKVKENEEDLEDSLKINMNNFKFKKFEELNVEKICELYQKSKFTSNKLEENSNHIKRTKSIKSSGKKINVVNKSMNSTTNFMQNHIKKDEKSGIIPQNEKDKYLGRDIELEVINADKGNFIL